MPWYLGNSRGVFSSFSGWWLPLAAWSLLWSGLSLWYAARRGEKWWFIFFLFVHTAGIIELAYLAFVVKFFSEPTAKNSKKKS